MGCVHGKQSYQQEVAEKPAPSPKPTTPEPRPPSPGPGRTNGGIKERIIGESEANEINEEEKRRTLCLIT